MNASTVSAISILVALVGVTTNALCTTPYTGASYCTSEKELRRHELKARLGRWANRFIVAGTAGQLVSLFLHP